MSNAQRFSAAIFDVDGLLLDSERMIMRTWLSVAAKLGNPLTEADYMPVIGLAAADSDAHLTARLGASGFEAALGQVRAALTSGDARSVFPAKAGAHEILERLRAMSVPCGVASSTATVEVERRLGAVDLRRYFDVVVGGDQVPKGKPDPALYRRAVELLGEEPARCIAFEDSENGLKAAVAAGLQVVLIPDLKAPTVQMRRDAFVECGSLEQVLPHLQAWFSR